MADYIDIIEKNLTEEDKYNLKAIYEPTVVAVPVGDACQNLCVTKDGEIRVYGKEGEFNQWGAHGDKTVYISSFDGGLSWKKHYVKDLLSIGCAGFSRETGRYIAVYPNEFRCEWDKLIGKKGTWAVINDEGFDSSNNKYVKISDLKIHSLRLPFYSETKKRWFVLGECWTEEKTKCIAVAYSDDNGESWTTNILKEHAPLFEKKSPHKGIRWQEYSCEPTMVELEKGKLIMYVRTSQDYHYMYTSDDGGESWSGPVPTDFHGTITMPVLHKLRDGRILFFWCNTQPMPEIDQTKVMPPLPVDETNGRWEDVFTNRDVNHLAISEDNCKTWYGMRELLLNHARFNADFRRTGGFSNGDKSVHQAQMLELPFNKLLIHCGQHNACRKVMIFDIDWLYEKERTEDFISGLTNLTTHMYLESVIGCRKGRRGHCAYNRTNGAVLLPSPDLDNEEVLSIGRIDDERLVYKKQGAVWNFPASNKGTVEIELNVLNSGVLLSLCDHWCNAFDETVEDQAYVSYRVENTNGWEKITFLFDTEKETVEIKIKDKTEKIITTDKKAPLGLSYLHIQTLAEKTDFEGTIIRKFSKK